MLIFSGRFHLARFRHDRLCLVIALLSGCAAAQQQSPPPTAAKEPTSQSPPPTTATATPGGFTRKGVVGQTEIDLEVKAVERHRDLTALKMEIVSVSHDYRTPEFGYSVVIPTDFAKFWLVDPVNKKIYFTLRESDKEKAFGTRSVNAYGNIESFRKGVRYPVEVYFPPLPPDVKTVTVIAAEGLGELTGIPVTDGAPAPVAKPRQEGAPEPGGPPFQWPVMLPTGDHWAYTDDIQEYVERPERSVTQKGEEETVALRTDVLFAFDKATLSPKAAAVLDEVARETRERADPAKPPVVIEGHTDSKGEDAYNRDLSVRRAQVVRDHLARELGDDYTYEVAGKGESEPIAKNTTPDGADNPEGRARNRRVEISYKVKNRTPDVTTTVSPSTQPGGMAEPAPLRNDLGPVVGSITRGDLRLDVHPLYRDGAFLVAPFAITNNDDSFVVPVPQPFSAVFAHEFAAGAAYSGITLVDEGTKARYYGTRVSDRFWVQNQVTTIPEGATQRGFVYFPAPPEGTKSMTFEVKDLGTVKNVPIVG
ncbi:OmpA family protein [Nonomuraea sp. SYSU D8015]|uniref:OmpA family protein n=1 Tax=Nonomuraea sp. SYSU D8015 TaxID=2593644 RepID=UPI001660CD8A|nr:OmpA family protein [Nonomuraea sp. SYSU D8015]